MESRESWNEPKIVEGLKNVKVCAAFASGVVSAAVGDDGSVWVWGKSKRGQLGLGEHITEAVAPARVEALSGENVAKVLYLLACLLDPLAIKIIVKKLILFVSLIEQVSFGWGHALAKTVDGKLFGWGYSADGRIGKMGNRLEASPLDSTEGNDTQLTSSDLEDAEKRVLQGMENENDMPIVWEPRLVEELRGVQVVDIACGLDHSLVLCRK